jgi:hypothetical protein
METGKHARIPDILNKLVDRAVIPSEYAHVIVRVEGSVRFDRYGRVEGVGSKVPAM